MYSKRIMKKSTFKRILKYGFLTVVFCLLSILVFYFAVKSNVFGTVLTEKELLNYKNETASLVLTEDEVIVGKYYQENRTNASFSDFPEYLIYALVATEDARFFEHKGIDSKSMLRVFFKSILMRNKRAGGGSTISQQLAKNMSGRKRFGFLTMAVNKTKEIIQAKRIENVYSKEEIIQLYLNAVSFGENIYGIETASLRYFNKKVSQLTIEESAVLIGMLKANTFYNPNLNPKNALKRRNVVLNQMKNYYYLEPEVVDSLSSLPLNLSYNNLNKNNLSGHFVDFVKKEATYILDSINKINASSYDLEKDGLIIKTTLNYNMQSAANTSFKLHLSGMQDKIREQYNNNPLQKKALNDLVKSQLKRLNISKDSSLVKRKQSVFNWKEVQVDSISKSDSLSLENTILHAGLLAISPRTGAIKTYVGGINHQRYPYDQIFSQRQLASTFKPILYATAFESGKSPCEYLNNDKISLSDFENWSPTNADKKFGGKYSLQGALLNSKNIPTINLYMETNFTALDSIWNRFNFSSQLKNNPSLSLGTVNASIYELARAYSSFANYGKIIKPYAITSISTTNGTLLYQHKQLETKTVLSKKTVTYINKILENAIERGTGTSLRTKYNVNMPLAGKTGTSQDYTDAWFVGYNPDIVMVSRVGSTSPKIHFNNSLGAGSSLALPLVAKTLNEIEKKSELLKHYSSKFEYLTDVEKENLDCDDFKEQTSLEKFFDFFRRKNKSFSKAQERTNRKAARKQKREERQQKKN